MPPDGDASLAADELQSLSFGSSERSRSASTVSTSSSGPIGPPPSRTVQLSDLRFVRRLGAGDIGSVYLAEVRAGALVAAKVMDRKELQGRNKEGRARTEREILEAVDHPFLPRLYGVAEGERWSCLLTEFCPGGDLHVLRQRQPHRRFSEAAVSTGAHSVSHRAGYRYSEVTLALAPVFWLHVNKVNGFYVAEVVAALEYIHMMDIVYRDLKPENVLVRGDGHIMLTDFDLSLKCDPTAPTPAHVISDPVALTGHSSSNSSSCIIPSCIVPSVSCFSLFPGRRRRKIKAASSSSFPTGVLDLEFVAEPVELRSMSFVGTHEYLAPEIVSGEGHGSSVDWWTLGIFIFELLYGATPFKGHDNEMTLANIVARALEFPKEPSVSSAARDLVAALLAKDPARRLGATVGAAAIKRHPFFNGVNWALLRCAAPPYVPPPFSVTAAGSRGPGKKVPNDVDDLSDDSCPGTPVEYY
ncbi:hypothetical protein ACQ4PT_010151 [Festuca glaucescens]